MYLRVEIDPRGKPEASLTYRHGQPAFCAHSGTSYDHTYIMRVISVLTVARAEVGAKLVAGGAPACKRSWRVVTAVGAAAMVHSALVHICVQDITQM